MGIDGLSSIGQTAEYSKLLSGSDKIINNVDIKDPNAFAKAINQVLVQQLTTTLFSGGWLGSENEYTPLMQDAFSSLFADQLNIIDYKEIGAKNDK